MKQRFFLYGVGVGRDDFVVIERIEDTSDILANSASADFAFGYEAAMGAQ